MSNAMGDMMNYMMGFGILMILSVALVIIGIILLVIWLVRHSSRGSNSSSAGARATDNSGEEAPLAILKRRYARGEIGPEEYERIRADLLQDSGSQ
jgi:putative membrane protein